MDNKTSIEIEYFRQISIYFIKTTFDITFDAFSTFSPLQFQPLRDVTHASPSVRGRNIVLSHVPTIIADHIICLRIENFLEIIYNKSYSYRRRVVFRNLCEFRETRHVLR